MNRIHTTGAAPEDDRLDWATVDACQLCGALADYVTEDLDVLCERCTVETGAEVRNVLGG